ncbi:MAG: energy transducer TonB [Candidatus Omnitrophota bacterium]
MRKPENKIFIITLAVSLLVHAVFFLPPEFLNFKVKPEIKYKTLHYPKTTFSQAVYPSGTKSKPRFTRFRGGTQSYQKRILKNIGVGNQDTDNTAASQTDKLKINTARFSQSPKRKISVAKFKQDNLSQDEIFVNYYRQVNEQLRQSVVYPDNFSEGEIALTFVLACDGSLRSVEVIDSTSPGNISLCETAMQIVEKASPFPPFPENLQQSQLTFNVVICFREHS